MYNPKYTISNKILRYIGTVEASKEIIDKAPLLPFYERKFQSEAMVRSVHFGTRLEGNELDLNQAERVMLGQEVVARERDVQEVINYRNVMEFIGETYGDSPLKIESYSTTRPKNPQEMTEELIRKLHVLTTDKILDAARIGVYRNTQVVVKNSMTGEVSFKPPLAVVIPHHMRELISFINEGEADLHPVLKSGIVHFELVRIHPFIDGNGRVARALSTLILFQNGYDIRKFFSLEEYYDSDATTYYEALQSVAKNNGDLTQWLEYFSEGLAIELAKIKDRIERISIDIRLKQKLGKQLLLTERQLKIIEYIQKTGYLENKAFKTLFPMISEDTVLNDLKALMEHRLLRKQGVTKAAKYVLS